MTIIEFNIAGLHVTRFAPSRAAVKRWWQRQCAAFRRNVNWPAQIRARQASDQTAA